MSCSFPSRAGRLLSLQFTAVAVLPVLASAQLTISQSTFEPGAIVGNGPITFSSTVGQLDAGPPGLGGSLAFFGGFWPQGSGDVLAVDLVAFEVASPVNGQQPLLRWVTGAEFDSAGFHLYRGIATAGGWMRGERLTAVLVPAQGDPLGGSTYEFADPLPYTHGSGSRAYYLEEIDLSGKPALYGPIVLNEEAKNSGTADWYAY